MNGTLANLSGVLALVLGFHQFMVLCSGRRIPPVEQRNMLAGILAALLLVPLFNKVDPVVPVQPENQKVNRHPDANHDRKGADTESYVPYVAGNGFERVAVHK